MAVAWGAQGSVAKQGQESCLASWDSNGKQGTASAGVWSQETRRLDLSPPCPMPFEILLSLIQVTQPQATTAVLFSWRVVLT